MASADRTCVKVKTRYESHVKLRILWKKNKRMRRNKITPKLTYRHDKRLEYRGTDSRMRRKRLRG